MPVKTLEIDQIVRWTNDNRVTDGVVDEIVPAGKRPKDVGFIGFSSLDGAPPRSHESYIIRVGALGECQYYWPRVSTLTPINTSHKLSPFELAWCKKHARLIRDLMRIKDPLQIDDVPAALSAVGWGWIAEEWDEMQGILGSYVKDEAKFKAIGGVNYNAITAAARRKARLHGSKFAERHKIIGRTPKGKPPKARK
jgi:hypothetical protein